MKLDQDKGQVCQGSVSLMPPDGERERLHQLDVQQEDFTAEL